MKPNLIALVAAAALVAACDSTPGDRAGSERGAESPARAVATASDADVVVYKSPTCGCCSGWIEHLRESGYSVEAVDLVQYSELSATKREHGVPDDLGSCHTAVVEGYTIEGHVPAEVIERLLRERPDIAGLSVPGMPIGSPGMEGPDPEAYDVMAFTEDGEREVYERVDPR
jgi:hypothetical protein